MVGAEDEGFSFCMKTLLDRLVEGQGVHCGVCMRGGEEITLVRPRRVKELIQYHGFKIFDPVDSTVPWACVLCESAAAHALRAHAALRCAARVSALVTELRVTGTSTKSKNNSDARRVKLAECEEMLRSVRGARRLVRTDVLVVDSTGARAGGDAMGHKRAATQTPSGLRPIAPSTSKIETVILDDDEDPLAISPELPPLVPPSTGPPSTGPPSTGPPTAGKLVQLTPLVSLYNASNLMYVPQQNNNQNLIVFIDNDCTVQKDDIAELMLKGTEDGARKKARLGGSGGSNPPEGVGSPGGHYVVDIDDVTGMIKEQNRKQQIKKESRPLAQLGPGRRGAGRAGGAVPNGARVDWEDKIPMDVISFMDATDPNAAELIVPERGLSRGGRWDPPLVPDPPFIDLS